MWKKSKIIRPIKEKRFCESIVRSLVITNNRMENVWSHLGGTRGFNLLVAALVRFTLGIGGLVEITTKAALSPLQ
ncbi:MAG: hypothetical protein KIH08_16710 [Candidatus Freyarchaeota archaeon]|nr:hypothetical protein [Candidatus Jordarchaeia archaeon]MBS7270605.1 hypothetical protein [Candidatus Jordarchaeia archaeon]MBS7281470.1 hypothetical protein [Candidatus Jordarchaeia archaeon]